MKKLKVLFVAAEAAGLLKEGGLGDVAGELPAALSGLGADVLLAMPAYRDIAAASSHVADFRVMMGDREETCVVSETRNGPVRTLLIGNDRYFGRPGIYGYDDDPKRFAFFCMAVFTLLKRLDFKPDIVHLNDWHTAPIAMLARESAGAFNSKFALVYTIHSLAYQGLSGYDMFRLYDVGDAAFTHERVEFYGSFNPMKAGIYYSDRIVAVSKTGAAEMAGGKSGFGLEGFILNHRERLRGIINGIDYAKWNPETDGALYRRYSVAHPESKAVNKDALRRDLGLDALDAPLFGIVSRLADVKGIDLLIPVLDRLMRDGCQAVILGKGNPRYEKALEKLRESHPKSLAVRLAFDEELARRIYAASDIFLMPSRYEPCGISQLIAMRYGAIPVVRSTGGLADTVIDEAANRGAGTGFTFHAESDRALMRAVNKAVKMYRSGGGEWNELVGRAMVQDFSWEKSAREYMAVYNEAIKANRERRAEMKRMREGGLS